MNKKSTFVVAILLVATMLLASCAQATPVATEAPAAATEAAAAATEAPAATESALPKVFAAFATPIEEPWDGVIHAALQKASEEGKIEYTYTDNIGYTGDMERVLREICENEKPDLIMGDGFGNEEAIRRVAADYPEIAFAFGSGEGLVEPNFSVFDNYIHEAGYLMGMYAGGLTEANVIGIVGPYPVPESARIINAFIAGAQSVNPDVKFMISWINSWYDPAATQEAAQAHIDNGADIIYGYPYGAIEPASTAGLYTFGMMEDQSYIAPDYVVSSALWDMTPTVEYLVSQIQSGSYTAMDLKDFSMMAKGGASLAPLTADMEAKLPAELVAQVKAAEEQIKSGALRISIDEHTPTSD